MKLPFRHIPAERLHYLPSSDMHPADTYFHFSFAHYYDPDNLNFGVLRVLNDDAVLPHSGFDRHPHRDVEIVTYLISGELTHWDSVTQQEETLRRGDVQTVTAGTGLWHSEMNQGDEPCRLLQIWILPPKAGLPVRYQSQHFAAAERTNRLQQVVGRQASGTALPLSLHQDVNFHVAELTDTQAQVHFSLAAGRQVYINNFEGALEVEGLTTLQTRDSLEVTGPAELSFKPAEGDQAYFILIEMPEGNPLQR